jgi:hypothetical protein
MLHTVLTHALAYIAGGLTLFVVAAFLREFVPVHKGLR